MIKLNVIHTGITASDRETLIAGNVNSISVEFSFSEDWDGLTHVAVFTNGSTRRSVLLDGNTCPIPWEVLVRAGRLFVSVRGIGSEGTFLLCTEDEFLGCVIESSASDIVSETSEVTPDVLDSLLARINELEGGGVTMLTVNFDLADGSADKTYAEIRQALEAGIPIELRTDEGYIFRGAARSDDDTVIFSEFFSDIYGTKELCTVSVNAEDEWSYTSCPIAISAIEEYPAAIPSCGAVTGYVDTALGDIEDAIDGILALVGGD